MYQRCESRIIRVRHFREFCTETGSATGTTSGLRARSGEMRCNPVTDERTDSGVLIMGSRGRPLDPEQDKALLLRPKEVKQV
ncbi:hypothetical protein EVAR_40189_1 [Eumeta japonica]|uniref:Uncharacterized protein n=1 Tax=Eumeta variegata TaxID=151549 RepID=A0A4C1XKH5_EUMVA|nr:hypothetical protein EVAR_40189_1 [Eumeta japonica]